MILERADESLDGIGVRAVQVHADPELDQLTTREKEVLRHIARGYTYKEVAARLLSSVRKGDCVAREGDSFLRTVARHGGDEFLVMLSDVDEAHQAARAARRILESLRRPFQIDPSPTPR